MSNNFIIVSIEGNIGSGKSTLLSNLRNYYEDDANVVFLKEPVDEWNKINDENGITILEKFYSDQSKYSFPFQMLAYVSRLKVLRDVLKGITNFEKKTIIITERSLYTDKMVFAKMLYDTDKIEHINYQIYLNLFNTFSEEFPVHKIVYVKTIHEICHSRIQKRSRKGETNIPIEYLFDCGNYHDDMLEKLADNGICNDHLVLDGNIDIYKNTTQITEWIDTIDKFIKI
jgi:deoxyadenosine/deoxycytidine kinase